jgi:hypothetical protein
VHYYWCHYWPIVPTLDYDGWWCVWSNRCNASQEKPNYSEKICLSFALSTTNPTSPDLGSNMGSRVGKPATNLRHGLNWYTTALTSLQQQIQFSKRFVSINKTRQRTVPKNVGQLDKYLFQIYYMYTEGKPTLFSRIIKLYWINETAWFILSLLWIYTFLSTGFLLFRAASFCQLNGFKKTK